MKTDWIEEFILQQEDHLRIALTVEAAMPNARHKLAMGFLDRLDARLKADFPGWKSSRQNIFFGPIWGNYVFEKPEWAGQYGLLLQFEQFGKHMQFGVCRDFQKLRNRPHCDELFATVRQLHPSANKHDYWEARIAMRYPATDWTKPEVLWQMHNDAEFLEGVASQLSDVAKISEPIIERWVLKLREPTATLGAK